MMRRDFNIRPALRKLTPDQVYRIRQAVPFSPWQLARELRVSHMTVYRVRRGDTYKDVPAAVPS